MTDAPAIEFVHEQTPIVDLLNLPGSPVGALGQRSPSELGMSLGAFTLYPQVDLLVGFDDNVFATPAPAIGSAFTVIRPQLELRSEWLNHYLRLLAGGGFGFYAAAPTQNFQNYNIRLDGRLDIRNDFYLTGLVAFQRATEALGTPNVTFSQAPTVADSLAAEVSLYQRFNRFFYQLTATATKYWYYEYSNIASLGLPAQSRNRTEFEERVRLGYEVSEGISVWLQPGINQRRYESPTNTVGQQRDSNGWFMNLGATAVLSPKTQLEGFVGYQTLSYPADGTSTNSMIFGLRGVWNGYEPLTLRPAIMRSINESALINYQNYISTTIGVDFTYQINGPWQAVGGVAYNIAEFTPAFGVANVNPRTDYFFRGSIGLLYSIRPQIQIGPLYEYASGWSTDVAAGGPAYTRNIFSIRLVARH
ncbi:outer membrane beta-barrel protein [Reyranella sp.]|uniref:outer membrane beta-barrel protein n=1 Tax=Reyranella sp. TaxID=1929291 RepID=UPI003783BB94